MDKIKIRALKPEEIEVKVSQVTEKGVQLLLYKDARCDKRILDETFGVYGWSNAYSEIKGNLYCSIMVQDPTTGIFFQKQDCGVESAFGDKEKGEASDAFKRACFNIGIGRELYTKIFIWVKAETVPSGRKQSGKDIYVLKDKFKSWYVKYIETDNEKEKIMYIEIADSKTDKVEFTWGKKGQVKIETKKEEAKPELTPKQPKILPKEEPKPEEKVVTEERLKELMKEANQNGDMVVRIAGSFGYDTPRKIKEKDFEAIKLAIQSEILM